MSRFVLLLLAGSLLLASCSDRYSDRHFDAIINDSIDLLSPQEEEAFLATVFPNGIVPYLITVDSLDPMAPGITADELLAVVEEGHPEKKAFQKRGFLLVVSRHPSLIQTRAGSKINNFTRWKGIISGPEYLDIQRTSYNDSLPEALDRMYAFLEMRLPELDSISWWSKAQYNQAMGLISNEVEEFGTPSDSFYGNYLLKPVLKLRFWELERFGTWWVTYLVVALIIFLLTKLVNTGMKYATRNMKNQAFQSLINSAFSFGIGFVLSIPALSSAVILSSGRLEDILALESFGLTYAGLFSMSADSFGAAAPWYLIGALFVLRLLKGMGGYAAYFSWTFLPEDMQRKNYQALSERNKFFAAVVENQATKGVYFEETMSQEEFLKKPYTHAFYNTLNKESQKAGLWAALAFGFLSKAIVLAAVYLWLFPVLQAFVDYLKTVIRHNKTYPEYRIPMYTLIILPLALFGFFALFQMFKVYSAYLLLGLSFLMSSGILLAVIADTFIGISASWQLWALSLSIPAYLLIRVVVAFFQTYEKLWRSLIWYGVVTVLSFGVLVYLYLGQENFDVRGTVVDLFPKTASVLKEQEKKEALQGVITIDALIIRQGPGKEYGVEGQLWKTDTFEIIDNAGAWWEIRKDSIVGYVHADYVREVVE